MKQAAESGKRILRKIVVIKKDLNIKKYILKARLDRDEWKHAYTLYPNVLNNNIRK